MGYPYPNFCLCAFWGPFQVSGLQGFGVKGSDRVQGLGFWAYGLGPGRILSMLEFLGTRAGNSPKSFRFAACVG